VASAVPTVPPSVPDEALAELAKADAEVFGVLYDRHVQRIYSYIYYRVGDHHEAEDLTEKTFFQAMSHLSGYEVRSAPFSAWLFRIAHNLVANWHRDNARRRPVPLDESLEIRDPERAPEDTALWVEEREELREAIAMLPAERQHLLVLKFVQDLPNAHIARAMGRTEGAVKALLHRTLVSLRSELAKQSELAKKNELAKRNELATKNGLAEGNKSNGQHKGSS
jgi:RNA polymerase sigma-70 factor, ECF subfamily